jgi:hypothetical protein
MELPIYELKIQPEVDGISQVDFVALVDLPAIEKDFIAFGKDRTMFQIVSEEQRIISGPLMIADKPMFRSNNEIGDHYVVFKANTIKDIAIKFAKKGFQKNVNEMHDPGKALAGVTLFESFITDTVRGIQPMKGYEDAPDGSWFGSMYIENEATWQDVKAGKFKGFSVEGMFIYDKPKLSEEQILSRLQDLFSQISTD